MYGALRAAWSGNSPLAVLSSLPTCASPFCPRPGTLWQRWWARNEGVWLRNQWFCSLECFQAGLSELLLHRELIPAPAVEQLTRMPLGLVLLSQGAISAEQLRQALNVQRTTRTGKLGEWLVRMGAVREEQVTAALGIQQRCPVFSPHDLLPLPPRLCWPAGLVQQYRSLPIFYEPGSEMLFVGFLDTVDHRFLYSIEQVLGCRTQPCIVAPATYHQRHQMLLRSSAGESISICEKQNAAEMARIIVNYAQEIRAERCLLTCCKKHLWVRLQAASEFWVDFLFTHPGAGD